MSLGVLSKHIGTAAVLNINFATCIMNTLHSLRPQYYAVFPNSTLRPYTNCTLPTSQYIHSHHTPIRALPCFPSTQRGRRPSRQTYSHIEVIITRATGSVHISRSGLELPEVFTYRGRGSSYRKCSHTKVRIRAAGSVQ